LIASSFDEPELFSFSVETGQMISRLRLAGRPSEIALRDDRLIAMTSSAANTLSFVRLDENGQLTRGSNFKPVSAAFSDSNNPAFSGDGRSVYVAAADGEQLFQIDVDNGVQMASIKVAPSPQQITVGANSNGGDSIGGVVIVESHKRLAMKSEFRPPDPIEFSSANNVVFVADGSTAFVDSISGTLFAFRTDTGELQSHQVAGGALLGLAINNKSQTVAAIGRTVSRDEILIAGFEFQDSESTKDASTSKAEPVVTVEADSSKIVATRTPAPDAAAKGPSLRPASVPAGRSNLKVRISGANFTRRTRIYVSGEGKDFRIKPRRVRFLSSRRIIVSLGGELNQLIAQPGVLKFRFIDPGHPALATEQTLPVFEPRIPSIDNHSLLVVRPNSEQHLKLANAVHRVAPEISGTGVSVTVNTDGPTRYEDFTLSNPSRIVVDVIDARNAFGNRIMQVRAASVERVRVGVPRPGVVRVVLDTRGAPAYRVTQANGSLVITSF
jgi:hypothetical protein